MRRSAIFVSCSLAILAVGFLFPAATSADTPSLTEPQQQLKSSLLRTLAYYHAHPVDAAREAPWSVMHRALAFGVDTSLVNGQRQVNAIGWLCWNQPTAGQRLLGLEQGLPAPLIGVGLEGHEGQFLSVLAQSRVRPDYELHVAGRNYTVADLVTHEQRACRSGSELTFQLIGLSHYLPHGTRWRDSQGGAWDIPRLIREELGQPIHSAACGGSHRLMGLSYAVRKCERRELEIEGEWARAAKYLREYGHYTLGLQNPDGSFSTSWFAGRAQSPSLARRLETSGHMLEWLAFSLPRSELNDPRVLRAVTYLNDLLWNGRQQRWGAGPLGHALHALVIYDQRALGGLPGQPAAELDLPAAGQ